MIHRRGDHTNLRYVPIYLHELSSPLPVLNSRFNHEIIFTTADAAAFVVLSNRQLYQSSLLQNASCLWVRSCFIFMYKSHDFTTLLLACIDITSATIYSLIELVLCVLPFSDDDFQTIASAPDGGSSSKVETDLHENKLGRRVDIRT